MGNFRRDNSFGGRRGGGGFSGRDSGRPTMHRATCSECGDSCEVPFKPTGDKPVFCSQCFKGKEDSGPRRFDRKEPRRFDRKESRRFDSGDKKMYEVVCDKCGKDCEVPFKPSSDKPVYCNQCFGKDSDRGGSGQSNKQLEMINNKLDKILKMLGPSTPEKVEEKKVAVKKTEKPKAKAVKTSTVKAKKVVAPKKAKAKKKK